MVRFSRVLVECMYSGTHLSGIGEEKKSLPTCAVLPLIRTKSYYVEVEQAFFPTAPLRLSHLSGISALIRIPLIRFAPL